MKEQMQQRLEELRSELAKGRELAQNLQRQQSELGEQMARISGAIQVLEELLAAENHAAGQAETEGDGSA